MVSRPGSQCSGSSGREAPLYRTRLCDTCLYLCSLVLGVILPRACSLASAGAGCRAVLWLCSTWRRRSGGLAAFDVDLQSIFSAVPSSTYLSLETQFLFWVLWSFHWTLASYREPLFLRHWAEWRTFIIQSVTCTWQLSIFQDFIVMFAFLLLSSILSLVLWCLYLLLFFDCHFIRILGRNGDKCHLHFFCKLASRVLCVIFYWNFHVLNL